MMALESKEALKVIEDTELYLRWAAYRSAQQIIEKEFAQRMDGRGLSEFEGLLFGAYRTDVGVHIHPLEE